MHRFVRLALGALVAATLVVPVAPAPVATASALPPAPASWATRSFSGSAEALLVVLTNSARASHGLGRLAVDTRLASIARSRSRDMAERSYFSHNIPPTGITVLDVIRRDGISYSWAGENIGWNTNAASSATQAIEQAFLNSAPHRANVLRPQYNAIGVGAYRAANGRNYFTVLFMQGRVVTGRALAATARVASRVVRGTRITVWAAISGGTPPYRVGWYLDGRRLGSTARLSFVPTATGPHTVRLVVVDARGTVLRRSATMTVLAHG